MIEKEFWGASLSTCSGRVLKGHARALTIYDAGHLRYLRVKLHKYLALTCVEGLLSEVLMIAESEVWRSLLWNSGKEKIKGWLDAKGPDNLGFRNRVYTLTSDSLMDWIKNINCKSTSTLSYFEKTQQLALFYHLIEHEILSRYLKSTVNERALRLDVSSPLRLEATKPWIKILLQQTVSSQVTY